MYACPHCGTPTNGSIIGKVGNKVIWQMCQGCEDFIGSPAAQQDGATMANRIEMERKYERSQKWLNPTEDE